MGIRTVYYLPSVSGGSIIIDTEGFKDSSLQGPQ